MQVIYTFIETQKANHRVSVMCRTLKISKSGFYSWRDRAPSARAKSDAALSEKKIVRIHRNSRETYGARRIHFELRTLGVRCGRKRVARLMAGSSALFGCGGRRRKVRTTLRSQTERTPPAPELVKRNFTPEAPNHLWVAHITYVRTWQGWLYLALARLRAGHLLKEGPRLVHAEQPQNRARARCLENMAIYNRRPQPGLIHHSDRGNSTPPWSSGAA
jgi:putative transposase